MLCIATTQSVAHVYASHSYETPEDPNGFLYRNLVSEAPFMKGQSKRIWGELYKVLDSSDVIIQVHSCPVCEASLLYACRL